MDRPQSNKTLSICSFFLYIYIYIIVIFLATKLLIVGDGKKIIVDSKLQKKPCSWMGDTSSVSSCSSHVNGDNNTWSVSNLHWTSLSMYSSENTLHGSAQKNVSFTRIVCLSPYWNPTHHNMLPLNLPGKQNMFPFRNVQSYHSKCEKSFHRNFTISKNHGHCPIFP